MIPNIYTNENIKGDTVTDTDISFEVELFYWVLNNIWRGDKCSLIQHYWLLTYRDNKKSNHSSMQEVELIT